MTKLKNIKSNIDFQGKIAINGSREYFINGEIKKSLNKLIGVFTIDNISTAPVAITKIHASCGCMQTPKTPYQIPPLSKINGYLILDDDFEYESDENDNNLRMVSAEIIASDSSEFLITFKIDKNKKIEEISPSIILSLSPNL